MSKEFILKINRDVDGTPVSLENMSLAAADALKVFIESLSELGKLYEDDSNIKLSLRNGSIVSVLTYSETDEELDTDIRDVLEGSSYENETVRILRNIQNTIKANGLDYSVIQKSGTSSSDITSYFKEKTFTAKRGQKREWDEEVLFVDGVLFESGGKTKTNVHLDSSIGDIRVECYQPQAIRLNKFLYSRVYLAVLKKSKVGKAPAYSLLDSYTTPNSYNEYKNFYQSLNNKSLKRFDDIHNIVINSIERGGMKNGAIIKLLRLFNHSQSDRGIIRTILMALKTLRQEEVIAEMYSTLAEILKSGSTKKVI